MCTNCHVLRAFIVSADVPLCLCLCVCTIQDQQHHIQQLRAACRIPSFHQCQRVTTHTWTISCRRQLLLTQGILVILRSLAMHHRSQAILDTRLSIQDSLHIISQVIHSRILKAILSLGILDEVYIACTCALTCSHQLSMCIVKSDDIKHYSILLFTYSKYSCLSLLNIALCYIL